MLLPFRLWLGQKTFGVVGHPDFPAGVRISPGRLIKWQCHESELEGLHYAATKTTIPIPKLHRVHTYRGRLALELEYIQGCQTLQVCWRTFSDEQKCAIVDEMSGYIKQLRELEAPDEYRISSTDGGPCRDIRVGSVKRFGPFKDSTGFHECLRGGILEEHGERVFGTKVMQVHRRKYSVCFTHGDLGVQNILVKDGKIAAIIDWECAGWYPEYWEYTKMHYNSVYLPEFYELLAQTIDRYDNELEAERHMWTRLNQPLDETIR